MALGCSVCWAEVLSRIFPFFLGMAVAAGGWRVEVGCRFQELLPELQPLCEPVALGMWKFPCHYCPLVLGLSGRTSSPVHLSCEQLLPLLLAGSVFGAICPGEPLLLLATPSAVAKPSFYKVFPADQVISSCFSRLLKKPNNSLVICLYFNLLLESRGKEGK